MAAHASLYRTESRWGLYHLRTDYPRRTTTIGSATRCSRKQDGRRITENATCSRRRPDRRRRKGPLRQAAHPRDRLTLRFIETKAKDLSHATCERPNHGPVVVDDAKCIADKGCTVCVDVCPLDVLRISEMTGKAYMAYDECWYCMPCEADCPTGAVNVKFLIC